MNKKAQTLVEYSLILGIVAAALFAMQPYFKRGIQGILKVVADDMGPQGEVFSNAAATNIRIQKQNELKKQYNFQHLSTYVSSGNERKVIQSQGEGVVRKETPLSQTTSNGESYGVGAEYERSLLIPKTSVSAIIGGNVGNDSVQLSVTK